MLTNWLFLNRLLSTPLNTLIWSFIFSLLASAWAIWFVFSKDIRQRNEHLRKYWFIYLIFAIIFPLRYLLALFYKVMGSLNSFWFFILLVLGSIVELVGFMRRADRSSYSFFSSRRYGISPRRESFNRLAPYDDFIYGRDEQSALENRIYENELRAERREALKKAQDFLEPYYDIMGDLTLYNANCSIRFYYKGVTYRYICSSKNNNGNIIRFKAMSDRDFMWNQGFFNSILKFFSAQTTADSLYAIFSEVEGIDLSADKNENAPNTIVNNTEEFINFKKEALKEDVINVNSANEEELQKLPGINIVLAKKIISHRENVEEFSSLEDFFAKMNIKPHFANKIRKLIKVEKTKKEIKENKGRMLDI